MFESRKMKDTIIEKILPYDKNLFQITGIVDNS